MMCSECGLGPCGQVGMAQCQERQEAEPEEETFEVDQQEDEETRGTFDIN